MEEVIFLNTDPTFNLVLLAMKQLHDVGRLPADQTTNQGASIRQIERATQDDNEEHRYTWNNSNNFARTAGACFRMTMLEAMGIPRKSWPEIQAFQQNTREGNMGQWPENRICLKQNGVEPKVYWSKYD